MVPAPLSAVYGAPPRDLADPGAGALQLSPLIPGSAVIETAGPFEAVTIHAPPGTIERRYTLAWGLRALAPGGRFTALAAKDKGGARLRKELEAFGCEVTETARRHHRICETLRPIAPVGLDAAVAAGSPRLLAATGLWSQPGVFSWDRDDPGSALLVQGLPPLTGQGADLGCGIGYLARAVLASPAVTGLALLDIDRRAIDCARRNLDDGRAKVHWADALSHPLSGLDFVVMNPPFHATGVEDKGLGQAFIRRAAKALASGGKLYMVANRHLPYEAGLREAFKAVRILKEAQGFKVFEAIR